MPFNSLIFISFFFLFVTAYYLMPKRYRKYFILVGSWAFYSYGSLFNVVYLILVTLITYLGLKNDIKETKPYNAKAIISVSAILLILLSSKYVGNVFNEDYDWSAQYQYYNYLLQPIGISFYSLQAISLIVDQRKMKATRISFLDVSLFLSFFPQSIAGPIHRWQDLAPQFNTEKPFSNANLITGLKFMISGYFLKLIIADKLALIISPILVNYKEFSGLDILFGSVLFSYQIYFDFFGYSLIAIGVGKVLGFKINVNFNHPYKAYTFKDFWHRWHISLSQWFRDYVYIPLGGRQKVKFIFVFSILITFLISGFWHGGSFNFLLWGFVHGSLYLIEDTIIKISKEYNILNFYQNSKIILLAHRVCFFLFISFTWLIFRADSMDQLVGQFSKMLAVQNWSIIHLREYLNGVNLIFFIIFILTLLILNQRLYHFMNRVNIVSTKEQVEESAVLCICVILILLFGDVNQQQFLYFRF